MRKLTMVLLVAVLAGCGGTIPVKPPFPDAASQLSKSCDQLGKLPDVTADHAVKLSEVSKMVSSNYDKANKCAVLVDGWKEWYAEQKKIYEGLK